MNAARWIPPRVFRQAGMLLLAAVVPALLTATLHPRRPAWSEARALAPEVPWSTVAQWQAQVVLVDARNATAYRRGHVPGAVSLEERHWEEQLPALLQAWQPGKRVVVYCDSEGCNAAQSVARRLRHELDAINVWVLKGGWDAWLEAQKPAK
ncbi:MAG: rhodanese-like domain-containing protein [Opitutaceae bacterium]